MLLNSNQVFATVITFKMLRVLKGSNIIEKNAMHPLLDHLRMNGLLITIDS